MRAVLSVLVAGFTLAACTTTGGLDTVPPQVVGSSPEPGATGVAATTPALVTFSEPVDPATITSSTVVLAIQGGSVLAADRTLSPDGRTLEVSPSLVPPVPSTLVITLTSGVKDLAGNPLKETSWWWSLPAWLPIGGPVSGATRSMVETTASLAFDASGQPVVAYSAHGLVQARAWYGSEWAPLGSQPLSYSGAWSGYRPVIASSGSGLLVAWHEWVSGSVKNIFARRWNGTSWTLENGGTLSYNAANDSSDPAAASRGGLDLIAWSEYHRRFRVEQRRRPGPALGWFRLAVDGRSPRRRLVGHRRSPRAGRGLLREHLRRLARVRLLRLPGVRAAGGRAGLRWLDRTRR